MRERPKCQLKKKSDYRFKSKLPTNFTFKSDYRFKSKLVTSFVLTFQCFVQTYIYLSGVDEGSSHGMSTHLAATWKKQNKKIFLNISKLYCNTGTRYFLINILKLTSVMEAMSCLPMLFMSRYSNNSGWSTFDIFLSFVPSLRLFLY